MVRWRKLLFIVGLVSLALAGCADRERAPTSTPISGPAETSDVPTPTPEIHIVDRERLRIGVDAAMPPLVDLDEQGQLVGVEADLFGAIAQEAGLAFDYVTTGWDTLFEDLIAGEFDAVMGGVTAAEAPTELVDLSLPYLELGQVAVVLEKNQEIEQVADLAGKVVGIEPLSWGEYVVKGEGAIVQLSPNNLRYFEDGPALIEALFSGYVEAIVIDHTVVESYVGTNPGFLRILESPTGGQWLIANAYSVAVPRGADELLAKIDAAVQALTEDGTLAEIMWKWGYAPIFEERPRFVQDQTAASTVAGIEKVDEMTVRFVLNRPDPYFDYKMAVPAMAIHSPQSLLDYAPGGELGLHPVGTGPYELESWTPGTAITLTANAGYWGRAALVDPIVIKGEPDQAVRYAALKANEAQLVEGLAKEALDALDENPDSGIATYTRAPVNTAYLGMNRDRAPFDDLTVRVAIATCIDRAALLDTVYPTGTLAALQFVPPNTFGFTPGLLSYEHDTEVSTSLLETTGYESLTVTLAIPNRATDYLPDPVAVGELLRDQLAACSITVTLELMDVDLFRQQQWSGELGFYLAGWSADYPGPISFLNTHFAAGQAFGSPYPTIVDSLEAAAETTDRSQRQQHYSAVNQLLYEKAVVVPLVHGASSYGARADLAGVVTNPVRRESLAAIGPLTETHGVTTLVVLLTSEPLSLDPTDEMDQVTFAVTTQLFDTLVSFEPTTTVLTGSLALEWEANESMDVWEFTLRSGVRFHDGSALNADVVVANFERLWDPRSPLHVGRTSEFWYFQALFGGFRQPSEWD